MTDLNLPGFQEHRLFDRFPFFSGSLPPDLDHLGRHHFEPLWSLHPPQRPEIVIHGRKVRMPRWQHAYSRPYSFSGITAAASPVPEFLAPFLAWMREMIDQRLNGLLLNWYAADQSHYIGAHHDDTRDLVDGTPIVTISLGDNRSFRLRIPKQKGFIDFEARHGTVFVMPWETNLGVKHEVPHTTRAKGRRISITARAFSE